MNIRQPKKTETAPAATLLVYIVSFLWLEIGLHLMLTGSLSLRFLLFLLLFSVSGALVCGALTALLKEKGKYVATLCVLSFLTLYFGTQLVYCRFFKGWFYWELLASAGDALTDFRREAVRAIFGSLPLILLLLPPLVLYAVFGYRLPKCTGRLSGTRRLIVPGCALLLALVLFLCGIAAVNAKDEPLGDRYYYKEGFTMGRAAERFGVLTAMRLDTQYLLFGLPSHDDPAPAPDKETDWGFGKETDPDPAPVDTGSPEETSRGTEGSETTGTPETEPYREPIDTSPQVMDIDFDALIRNASSSKMRAAHEYFSSRTPTNKNAYTGMFAGKNLIFITVEAWAPAAINETLTPTLWKMKNEGFVFENYYCSLWGGSTATGEYANMTGNFYHKASCLKKSGSCYEPFALGNVLSSQGYLCCAFHNHKYNYYDRQLSHPNFGYVWRAIGKWDKSDLFADVWPRSDRELAENTLSYIPTDGTPFHFYYMTVSGHASQTFDANRQSRIHRDEVLNAGLPYTDQNALSYIAAQLEVEGMVKTLCTYLEEKGLLENTVFVMAPDHYPYTVVDGSEEKNVAALSALYGLPEEGIYTNPELYRAPLVIWSPSMKEPVHVKKVCSAIDILPTVLNLFGETFDSRLLTGQDIFSDAEGFAPLNMSNWGSIQSDNNWITDYGIYSAADKSFTPFPGVKTDGVNLDAYIAYHNSLLQTRSTYSLFLLDQDYYGVVFGKKAS